MAPRSLLAAALLAAAALGGPRGAAAIAVADVPTCPADGAQFCFFGSVPGATPPAAANITAGLALEALAGLPYTPVASGVCSVLTFTCNAALAALYDNPATKPAVVGIAAPCLSSASPPAVVASNTSIVAYGAFSQADCATTLGLIAYGLSGLPGVTTLLEQAVQSVSVCASNNCNAPPGAGAGAAASGARGARAAGAALLGAGLAAAALA
jgi:hypothetical protein